MWKYACVLTQTPRLVLWLLLLPLFSLTNEDAWFPKLHIYCPTRDCVNMPVWFLKLQDMLDTAVHPAARLCLLRLALPVFFCVPLARVINLSSLWLSSAFSCPSKLTLLRLLLFSCHDRERHNVQIQMAWKPEAIREKPHAQFVLCEGIVTCCVQLGGVQGIKEHSVI